MNKEEMEALRSRVRKGARAMYFSNETIDHFLARATPGQMGAVVDLLSKEASVREESKRARLMRKAKFPVPKSVEDFDFGDVAFPEGYSREQLLALDFVEHAQDFVFYGKTGRGKTHLAIALGMMCVGRGYSVRFFSTAELVLAMGRASEEGKLDQLLKDIYRADVLILDEFGYVPIDAASAKLLFQVVSNCYETRSIIFTTNIEFSKWGTILADEKLASAMLDRIVHHGRLVEFNGPSRRIENSLMLGNAR